ncbi:MAG: hypothetical protein J0H41_04210 [Rhizobiales bacterium]|nr:hypothetical protein [Hyphomicrobiales bacterium]
MNRLVAGLAALFALAALFTLAAPAFAQTKGVVRGANMNGYGRLIFTFDDMRKASATVTAGVLVVAFDRPIAIDIDKTSTDLPGYIGVARRDPDGTGLRFALAQPVRAHVMEAGEKIFIDLLPASWRDQPPSLPQDVVDDLARRARVAEEALRSSERKRYMEEPRALPARVARRPGLTRIVFDMPVVTPVAGRKKDNGFEITFDAAFKVDLPRLKADVGDAVKSIDSTIDAAVTRVVIAPPPSVEINGFREDDTFVVDMTTPEAPQRRSSPEAERASPPDKKTAAPQQKVDAQQKTDHPPQAEASQTASDARSPQPPAAAPPIPQIDTASLKPIQPKLSRDGDTIRIAFPFSGAPPAAAFERFGVATLVFETEQPIEAAETPQMLKDAGATWSFEKARGATIVRLVFNSPALTRIAPDGDGWVATIGDRLAAASEPIAVRRTIDDQGRTMIVAPLPRAGRTYWIDDPGTGERLAVTTARAPLRSIARPYQFMEFELPPTSQGVAVVAHADDLVVRAGLDDVTIERARGLALSVGTERPRSADRTSAPASVVFDRAQWANARAGATRDRTRALEQKASEAQRGRRNAARIELARFLFANELFPETRGELETIVRDQPEAARDRQIGVLRLATVVRMGRPNEARKLIADAGLAQDEEAQPWIAAIDAQQHVWPRALAGFRTAEAVIGSYPDSLQTQMRALWARAAVEAHDLSAAQAQLDLVDKLDRDAARAEEVALLRARIEEEQGRTEEALAAYARIRDGADRQAAAEADLRSVQRGLADKAITRADAIKRLETISTIWRGDGFIEIEAIVSLGQLYAEESRWRDAFILARRGEALYPDNDKISALHDQAAARFEELFAEGHGDSIDRVQALALFYDFKDFTPPGRQGDEIVRRLAERLTQLDLLDQAAELLQHQIDHRLNGPYRSTLAARLAVIYLMDRKPAAALSVIGKTRLADLSFEVKRARNLLEARALSDLSRTDLALEVAGGESGPDVDRLAADIQWQGRRWRDAGETYERILGDRWKNPQPMSARERADVMRAAIAYSLSDEFLSLDRLRGKYGALLSNSADARAFQLVTSPSPERAAEFREYARDVARADTLAEFLEEYRKRYPDIPPPPRPPVPSQTPEAAATAPERNAATDGRPQTEGAATQPGGATQG